MEVKYVTLTTHCVVFSVKDRKPLSESVMVPSEHLEIN